MKRIISITLTLLMLVSALASCAPAKARLDDAISLASSDAAECAAWLDNRLEDFPTDVIVGIGSSEAYGIDMTDFEEDGYVLRTIGNDTLAFGASAEGLDRAVRKYAKAADAGTVEELDTVYHEGTRVEELRIGGKDISEFTVLFNYDEEIFIPGTDCYTHGNAKYAAEEFVRLIKQATGVELPMVALADKASVSDSVIVIDYYTEGDLGENGFTYKIEGGNLYMNGVGIANGCANAVYYFLQEECGWDALIYGDSCLTEAELVEVPEGTEKKVKPLFEWYWMREMCWDYFDTDRAVVNSNPDSFYRGSPRKPGHGIQNWGIDYACVGDGAFLQASETIYTYLFPRVSAGQRIGYEIGMIDLGMMDTISYCGCTECRLTVKEEGGAISAIYVKFANRISEELEIDFPGLRYSFYAYNGHFVPGKTKPNDNVHVTIAVNGNCSSHKIDGSECGGGQSGGGNFFYEFVENNGYDCGTELNNADYAQWIKEWCELTDNVTVFTYYLANNFAESTYGLRTVYDDLRFLSDVGVKGYTPEAEYYGMGFGRIRFQLMMDVIWHPEMTREEYEARAVEMMKREYGEGYTYVSDYIDQVQSTEGDWCSDTWIYVYLTASIHNSDPEMFCERVPQMYELLYKALELADTEKHEKRIRSYIAETCYKEIYKYGYLYGRGKAPEMDVPSVFEYMRERYEEFKYHFTYCGYSFDPEVKKDGRSYGPPCYNGSNVTLKEDFEEAIRVDMGVSFPK